MERMGRFTMCTMEELTEERLGPVGTPARDAYEMELEQMLRRHESALKAATTRKKNREEKLVKEKMLQEMATNIIIPNTVVKKII